jgi:hypothetical protein
MESCISMASSNAQLKANMPPIAPVNMMIAVSPMKRRPRSDLS